MAAPRPDQPDKPSGKSRAQRERRKQASREIIADSVSDPNAAGWYPEPGKFGYQRYWDGTTFVGPSRLGFGDEEPLDPYLERGSLRWMLAVASAAVAAVVLLSPLLSLLRGDGGQWAGLLLVGLSPILWLLAAWELVLLARLDAPTNPAAGEVARRSKWLAWAVIAAPFVSFLIGRGLFGTEPV